MSNKSAIIRECNINNNRERRVMEGRVSQRVLFNTISGSLLITGKEAGNSKMMAELLESYFYRRDMPNIVLTSHLDLMHRWKNGRSQGIALSYPQQRNYMPFYGMSVSKILGLISTMADESGFGRMSDQLMLYAAAVMNVVSTKYAPSLPAICGLLEKDDDYISELALSVGLSKAVADNIRGYHEAGIAFRRLLQRIEEVFENIYEPGSDTKYTIQSGVANKLNGMILYTVSSNRSFMNRYLKEELYEALKYTSKVRVIVDEMAFNKDDELLRFLLDEKKRGSIELILVTKNIKDSVDSMSDLDFENIVMFAHNTQATTDEVSKCLFGTYNHYFTASAVINTPHVLFSVKNSDHWQIQMTEKLKVSYSDLFGVPTFFTGGINYLAVKTTANSNVFLVPTAMFLLSNAGMSIETSKV